MHGYQACVEHNVLLRRLVALDAGQESLGSYSAEFADWLLDNRLAAG